MCRVVKKHKAKDYTKVRVLYALRAKDGDIYLKEKSVYVYVYLCICL